MPEDAQHLKSLMQSLDECHTKLEASMLERQKTGGEPWLLEELCFMKREIERIAALIEAKLEALGEIS